MTVYTVENTSKVGKLVKVSLDGKEVKYCVYADTEKGIVEFSEKDQYGRIILEDGNVKHFTKSGVVTVEPINQEVYS